MLPDGYDVPARPLAAATAPRRNRAGATGPAQPGRATGPGSTALSCLRQAPCPVVVLPTVADRVVPARRPAGAAGR